MEEFYNKHYILTDNQGRIVSGWSDGPHPGRGTAGVICINEQGGYQFRLFPGGEENPALHTVDGVPLYKWENGQAVQRTEGSRQTAPPSRPRCPRPRSNSGLTWTSWRPCRG